MSTRSTMSIGRCAAVLKRLPISRIARQTGFQRREPRRISALALAWAVIAGGVRSAFRGVSEIAAFAGTAARGTISRQLVHLRLTRGSAAAFFEALCGELASRITRIVTAKLPGVLGRFRDVALIDSTVIVLLARLIARFPACRTNSRKAALKVHTVMSLTRRAAERFRITSERISDRRGTEFGRWVRQRLVMFDLGYFDYGLFASIVRDGGDFLTRLKTTANGLILTIRKGCGQVHAGERLNDTTFRGQVIDLDARLGRGKQQVDARVVGIWNVTARHYHWYVTSVRPDVLAAGEVGTVYALRWQIEVLFKQWKSECKACDTRTANPDLAMALVYASIAYALLVNLLLAMACRWAGVDWNRYSGTRALKVVGLRSTELAEVLSGCGDRRRFEEVLERVLGDLVLHSELPNKTSAVLRAAAQIMHP